MSIMRTRILAIALSDGLTTTMSTYRKSSLGNYFST